MEESRNRIRQATMRLMNRIYETQELSDALLAGLEVILGETGSEAGVIWYFDKKTGRLFPVAHIGPADVSGTSVDPELGIEGLVTRSEEPILVEDAQKDPRFFETVFDGPDFLTKTMLCAPLKSLHETLGCVQIINRSDGGFYTEEDLRLCARLAAVAAMNIEEQGLVIDTGAERKVLISLRNVIKDYPSGEGVSRVLKGINLDIYENEFVVILGESGCGKSTMMNIIGGMDFLTDGELLIEGRDYSHPSDDELTRFRREYLGFIFQSYNLMPNLTALENIQFIAEIAREPIDPLEALDKVGMKDKAGSYPSQLSGGQQQRVSIARALVKNPRVILADEPTAALDFTTGQEVLMVIEDIVKNQNTTVVMITHNAEIAKMANRVVRLRSGKVASIKWNLAPLPASKIIW